MITPLQPFPVAGVIGYQGETNAGRANRYADLFAAMVAGWRSAWGLGDLPFLYVQVAPFQKMPPEIREAQRAALKKIPRSAMVVTTDVGDATDIHPAQKEPVGQRLALAARALAYGEKLEYSGPLPVRATAKDGSLTVDFEHAGTGLEFRNGDGRGFELAGSDGVFAPAQAQIEGNHVVLKTPSLGNPVSVRYGWANVPDVNLFNREGLPATPFLIQAEAPSN
jgi:sialate O-acetylesterase